MNEKISVLVITRNRSRMLSGCLKSIVKQTHLPDEVIIVDNSSTDDTKKVIISFNKKLPIKYVLEKQIGIPYARNKGLQHTTGTLILMLDDDCVADRFWVEKMIRAHKKYPKAWVIQGRTNSLPKERPYSLIAEFNRFLALQKSSNRKLPLRNFLSSDFREEMEISSCDTKNFSIKTSYLKKHNLLFDEYFYRGSDADLGRQIIQKKGLIMFCPLIKIHHWERSTLTQFLEQYWHIGRTAERIGYKWKKPSFATNMPPRLKGTFDLVLFCKVLNQWEKLPLLMILLYLDRLSRIIGWFYEKKILSIEND